MAPELIKKGDLRRFPDGQILGQHTGIHQFTYGQRKGLGVATGEPAYVVKVEENGTVWLGPEAALYSDCLKLKRPNWLTQVAEGEEFTVKIRFQHRGAKRAFAPSTATTGMLSSRNPSVRSLPDRRRCFIATAS